MADKLRLPPLPPTEPSWSSFQVWWQEVKEAIEKNEETQNYVLDALEDAVSGSSSIPGRFAILGSYTIPTMILTATETGGGVTVYVIGHVRRYGDTTEIAIAAGSIPGLAFSTTYGIYYDDAARTNAAPGFAATTNLEEAQHNYAAGRHYCGTITTPPASSSSTFGGAPPAGSGYTAGAGAQVIT